MKDWYTIHDWDQNKKKEGAQLISENNKALVFNKQHYGIFWAVNDFEGQRKQENLTSINSFYCDIDGLKKDEIKQKIRFKIEPSLVVETKSGFHLYWFLDIDLRYLPSEEMIEEYKDILKNRLVPYFGGDPNATDTTRILRVPNFFHYKNPLKPFLIKVISEKPNFYTFKDLCLSFSRVESTKTTKKISSKNDFWSQINEINCVEALERVSGTEAVSFETITLRPYKDTHQIYVDGKSTSCWVDRNGKIGSKDGGGPSIANWLNWYHGDWVKVASILKEYFPEVKDEDMQKV